MARNLEERFIPPEGISETDFRRNILSTYTGTMGKLCVVVNFDPDGTEFHPAIYDYPEKVAAWLRQLADDIEGIGKP